MNESQKILHKVRSDYQQACRDMISAQQAHDRDQLEELANNLGIPIAQASVLCNYAYTQGFDARPAWDAAGMSRMAMLEIVPWRQK